MLFTHFAAEFFSTADYIAFTGVILGKGVRKKGAAGRRGAWEERARETCVIPVLAYSVAEKVQ